MDRIFRIANRVLLLLCVCILTGGVCVGDIVATGPKNDDHLKGPDSFSKPASSADHVVVRREGRIPGTTERLVYRDGRIAEKLVYWGGQPWELTRYEYLDLIDRYNVKTMVYHGDRIYITKNDVFESAGHGMQPDAKIETQHYYFDRNQANTLRQVDTYWPGTLLVRERQMFDAGGAFLNAARFEYDLDSEQGTPDAFGIVESVSRMALMDEDGDIVCDYREQTDINLRSVYGQQELSEDEYLRRKQIFLDAGRTPILVMDGGIDISHPQLAYKLWKNPEEILNGIDDDGNGLADDIFGVSDNPRLSQPVQDLRLPRFGFPEFSHGTLVASIAAQGREDVAIMAASEMTANHSSDILPMVERFIKSHGVRFTNMSFIFDKQILGTDTGALRPLRLEQLIRNTPGTLHVVAAGNGAPINGKGFNVDRLRKKGDLVPAMLPDDNILVVGALDTDQLYLPDYPLYELASFSNVGELSVDILAPGTGMCGARMGGGMICEDGTSFAAPYLLNRGVLNVAKVNPDLDIYEIKEILMKTAYVPNLENPFPVRSGGILHPSRAVAAARWLRGRPGESVEAAALAVRKQETTLMPGEQNDSVYFSALQSYWERRGIVHTGQWYARAAKKDAHLD